MARMLTIGTIKGDDAFVVEKVVGREEMSRLFEYRVDLLSEKDDHLAKDLLGTNASIYLEMLGGADPRYFNGYVTRFAHLGATRTPAFKSGHGFRYQLTLSPWLWFLTRTSTCAIFQQKKILAVVEEVLGRVSELSSFEKKLTGDTEQRDYCVQYRETDFNFVSRLLEQEGIYYYFTHENGKHKLVLADHPGAHPMLPEGPELRYSASKQDAVTLRAWIHHAEIQSGAYAINDFDYNKPNTALLKVASKERPHKNAGFEQYDYPGEYLEPGRGSTYANIRMEELHCQYEVDRGSAVDRRIRVGHKFKLVDHPVSALNQEYLVLGHQFTAVNNVSSSADGEGATMECSLSVIPAATQYRPPRVTPLPSIPGPQTAIVVGKQGEEIETDALGRVKVQFHWDRYSTGSDKDSCWIRVSNPFAGKGWGAINIPRVGQEVIVQFMEGDPDRPIITGRVYNGENQTPYDMPAKKMITGMKTRSYPNGGNDQFNELRFDDSAGKEQVYLQAQKWLDFRVKSVFKEWIGATSNTYAAGSIMAQTGNEYHLTAKGDMFVTSKDGKVVVKAKDDIMVYTANALGTEAASFSTHMAPKVAVTGKDRLDLYGDDIRITGKSKIDLKVGGNFISITPGGIFIKGTMVNINSGGSASEAAEVSANTFKDAKLPAHAMNSEGGSKSPPPQARTKPQGYKGQASSFKAAAKGGSPLVKPCAEC
ncbi:type VI secretion system tip protein TssI/VgrG [Piscinibacter sakaiensis]|uniref:VgrG protein n=1 Tax=Piscinibacter sakaiensis TaxID=1547922 RepID=A0A0K8NWW4_PISS1|nr:type VI secretion system tip protein TssI/VgrG [Piscinibacter sakaiensis]GAP34871.1 VgrG protein [Piscinibacter sakaiensis]